MSKKRDSLLIEYKKRKDEDAPVQTCKVCGEKGMKSSMEPHHVKGRHGENILNYVWIHPSCHRWVHENVDLATQSGMMIKGRNI